MAFKELPINTLSDLEKQSIAVLNYMVTFDGVIRNEDEMRYMLQKVIEKFIPKKKQHMVSISETAYPIKIRTSKNIKPKGDWFFERQSGCDGYRCRKCCTWIYENDIKKCDCDI